jgi:hypothetical protein
MITAFTFSRLLARHDSAIAFGRTVDIKRGNRCAMVMGIALQMHPRKERGQTTMRDLANSPEYKYRNLAKMAIASVAGATYDETVAPYDQPFMDRFFVKAKDLAQGINEKFGPPDFSGTGTDFLKSARRTKKGVMYLGGFWHGGTGDHIDLWDGNRLNVTGTPQDSCKEIGASKRIWLWFVE